MNEKPKFGLGLPRVTIRGQIIPQSKFPNDSENVNYTSSNGPTNKHCGTLEVNLKTCAKETKLRVYNIITTLFYF